MICFCSSLPLAFRQAIRRRNEILLVVIFLFFSSCSFGGSSGRTSLPKKSSPRYVSFKNGGELSWPIAYGRIASRFGPRDGSFHDGLDLASDRGLAVRAAHSGTVVYAGNGLGGYGNLVIVRDKSGLLTIYAHNDRLKVKAGNRVGRGQVIALLGATGHATGPHLHFEVRVKDRRGRYVAMDPYPLLSKAGGKPRYRVNESLTPLLAALWR